MKSNYLFLILAIVILSLGCTQQVAKNGDSVSVIYSANHANGTLIDDNNGEPLTFTIGSGQVVTGFNYAVLGMALNEEKTVTLTPEEAYGEYDDSNRAIEEVAYLEKAGIPLELGTVVYSTDEKNRMRGVIIDNNGTHALIDFNHQLAGKTLIFKIKLVDINSHSGSAIN